MKNASLKRKNSMNKNIRILQFLVSIIYSVQSHFSGAQTIQLNGNGIPESITGVLQVLMETRRLISACRIKQVILKIYYLLKAVLTSKEEQTIHQSVVQVSTVKTLR